MATVRHVTCANDGQGQMQQRCNSVFGIIYQRQYLHRKGGGESVLGRDL